MSMNYHRLYLDTVFALAETLVIKSEYSADRLNDQLRLKYGVQSVDNLAPQTWKYYLNLCGEYHVTDQPIMVKSLDTMQTIAFTKENLRIHVATARGYRYGSRYYRELAAQNPTQELLLMGVLYPADMTALLASPDMQVVAYPTYLVEDNEEHLIQDINAWLTKFNHRWNIPAFNLTDELYGASLLGVMYAQLVPLIVSLRLRACRTGQAHSYHVRQYLASHGMLDGYLAYLTRQQAMFFYRNAAYIERNSGKTSTFEWLTQQVLTNRGLPLTEYRMQHRTTHMPDTYTPEVVFTTHPLNSAASTKTTTHSTSAILAKELSLANGNSEWSATYQHQTEESLKYVLNATAKTKMLESSLVDNSSSSTHSMQDVALAMWGYSAATGGYGVYQRIKNPQTGEELTLSMLQAYYYFIYAYCQVHTVQLKTVPKIYAQHVPRWPVASVAAVMSHIDPAYVTEAQVAALVTLTPQPMVFMNTDLFSEGCQRIFDAVQTQSQLVARQEHFYSQALLNGAFLGLYADHTLSTPVTGQDIQVYLTDLNLPTTGFTALEWQQIYMDLFQGATGQDMQATLQTSSMQKAMVKLMTQLSSYSVQFVSEVSGQEIRSLNWSAIRLGDSSGASRSYFELLTSVIEIFDSKLTARMRVQVPVKGISTSFAIQLAPQLYTELQLVTAMTADNSAGIAKVEAVLDIGKIDWDTRYDPNDPLPSLNRAAFDLLTPLEIQAIPNVHSYQRSTPVVYPVKADLAQLMHRTQIPSFQALQKTHLGLPQWEAFWGPQQVRYFSDDSTILVLNGIWPFGGTQTVNAFNPTQGNALVTSFKYFPQAYQPLDASVFHYTGGPLVSFSFGPGRAAGDVNLGTLAQAPQDMVLNLHPVTQVVDQTLLLNQSTIVSHLTFAQTIKNYEITFSQQMQSIALPALASVTRLTYLHLDQLPSEVDLTALENNYMNHLGPQYKPRQAVWHIAPLSQLFVAEGPSLFGYGVYELNPSYSLAPADTFNDTVQITLTASVNQHAFGFTPGSTRTVDIPDFAGLFLLVP